MKRAPMIYKLNTLIKVVNDGGEAHINGQWVPARPVGFYSLGNRIKAAWLVFTGKADVVKWPGDQ